METAVAALLAAQHGVGARRQLIHDCGLANDDVNALVRGRRLESIAWGVVAAPGAPRTPEFHAMAAQLRLGEGARIVGPRALSWLGLSDMPRHGPFGVLVPNAGPRKRLQIMGQPIQVFRDPVSDDRTDRVGAFRVPGPGRLMVEMARFVAGDRLRGAIDAGRWASRPTLEYLHGTVAALPENYVPAALMRAVLADTVAFQLESEGERRMRRALGPLADEFLWQHWIAPHLRVDALNPPSSLVLEYAGKRYHSSVVARAADRERDAEIRALALRPVHVTDDHVRRPPAFQRWVRALMAA